jgi:hypothetical protein
VASPEIRTPSRSFPLMASLPITLAKGAQETGGALANHKLSNQKFANRHQLFYWDVECEIDAGNSSTSFHIRQIPNPLP